MAEWIELAERMPAHKEEVFVTGNDGEIAYVKADLNDSPEYWIPGGVMPDDWVEDGWTLTFIPTRWMPGPFGRVA